MYLFFILLHFIAIIIYFLSIEMYFSWLILKWNKSIFKKKLSKKYGEKIHIKNMGKKHIKVKNFTDFKVRNYKLDFIISNDQSWLRCIKKSITYTYLYIFFFILFILFLRPLYLIHKNLFQIIKIYRDIKLFKKNASQIWILKKNTSIKMEE